MQQLISLAPLLILIIAMYFLMIRPPEKEGQTDSRDEEQPSGGRRDRHYRRNLRKDRKD